MGNDLVYSANITLEDALCSNPITILTLDGRNLFTPIDEIINPKSVKIVEGEGMPIYNSEEFSVDHFK